MLASRKIFDVQCFVMWPNGQTLYLTSKSQMFDKQCLTSWPRPYEYYFFVRNVISSVVIGLVELVSIVEQNTECEKVCE